MRMLKEEEASKRLGIPLSTLRAWRSGFGSVRGPAVCKMGGIVRYPDWAVEEYRVSRGESRVIAVEDVPLIDEPIPTISGVYVLMSGDTVVYVGSSMDLLCRLHGHEHSAGCDHVVLHVVEQGSGCEFTMAKLEEELIEKFNPPLNKSRRAIGRQR